MEINEYLFYNKISKVQFAEMIGVTKDYVHSCIAGRRRFSEKKARLIAKITNGRVSFDEARNPEVWKRVKA